MLPSAPTCGFIKPSVVMTIFAFPPLRTVTSPFASTVATSGSVEENVAVFTEASSGYTT